MSDLTYLQERIMYLRSIIHSRYNTQPVNESVTSLKYTSNCISTMLHLSRKNLEFQRFLFFEFVCETVMLNDLMI